MKKYPYPIYKPSGVEWLGAVPEHWEVKKVGLCFKIQLGKMLQPEPQNAADIQISYLKAVNVQWGRIDISELPMLWATANEVKKFLVRNGDLLVCEGGEVGRAAILDGIEEDIIIQNALHRVRSDNNLVIYCMYVLEYAATQKWLDILCNKATIAHFTSEKFSALKIPLPPFLEQQAIADFLDRETGKIDTLINKNRWLIELLKEKRMALISRAVTKGLDPTVKMKPSGVEWLGDVPSHWEVTRLKNAFHVYNGSTPESSKEEFWDGDITWYTPEDLGNNARKNILDSRRKITQGGYANIGATIVPKSSIIISTRAPIGHIAITDVPACTNQGCRSLVPKKNVWSDFHYYYLLISKNNLNSIGKGTTFIELGNQGLGGYLVPLPPLPEQQTIADFLDKETGKIDALIAKVEKAIEKLKEYRTALISAAVTGKIDVREAA